jgi:PAS domain S-box-containing protein
MRFLTSWVEVGKNRKPEDDYIATGRHVTDEQRLLAAIVESSEDAIISSTPAGVILTWNRGAEVIFGYKAGDTIGKRLSMLMAPDRLPELAYFAGQVSQGFTVSQYRSLCRRKDGREFQVSVTGSPLMNSAGEVEALSAILRDISKQKDAEEAIHESEERFRVMADGCPAVMWVTNAEGGIQFINRAYRELIGTTYEETEGHKWQVALHPEDSARYVEAFQRAVRDHTQSFLDDIPRQIEALRGYLDASNAASAERQAHSIKGASAGVGGEALRALAFAMEKAGKAGDLGSVRARMDDLEREFVRLKEAMAEQP